MTSQTSWSCLVRSSPLHSERRLTTFSTVRRYPNSPRDEFGSLPIRHRAELPAHAAGLSPGANGNSFRSSFPKLIVQQKVPSLRLTAQLSPVPNEAHWTPSATGCPFRQRLPGGASSPFPLVGAISKNQGKVKMLEKSLTFQYCFAMSLMTRNVC